MGANSTIEWTNATWTPIRARNLKTGKVGWHCEHASDGCKFCYAEAMNKRLGTGLPFKPGHRKNIEIFLDTEMLTAPLRWKKPRMVFVCSMTDLFADFVEVEWINKVLAVAALCPQHQFQVLTKRTERMREYVIEMTRQEWWKVRIYEHASKWCSWPIGTRPSVYPDWPLPNVWLGTSVERQQEADERQGPLRALATDGWTTFCSYEPALGPVDWSGWEFLDQLISGGESGPKARPTHPYWHRRARDWCKANSVEFFFKQWGAWRPSTETENLRYPRENMTLVPCISVGRLACMTRVGKRAAGRLLDGIEHNGMPKAAGTKQSCLSGFRSTKLGVEDAG